jgi:hypothetical protein
MHDPVYAVAYASPGARSAYVVAMIASGMGAMAGIATEQWALLAPAFALALVAERVRPYVGEHPQIRLDNTGLTLRGLGFVPWRSIVEARAFEHRTGAGVRAWLMLEISGELEERVARMGAALGGLQVKPWRRIGGRGLILRLEGLEDTPDAIRRAFERFLRKRIAVDRV